MTNKKKPLDDCQFHWLKNAILSSENILKKRNKTDEIRNYISILEDFMRSHPVICYGGTAINNILPKHAQFYDEDDIADYDMYSSTPLEHAKELADLFLRMGVKEPTASAGVHVGTFKVYVNFIAIADITFLPQYTFDILCKEAITMDGIQYASPDFLRMNMLYELSHTLNTPDRLEKVFLRFKLLNMYHPAVAPAVVAPAVLKNDTVCSFPLQPFWNKYFQPTLQVLLEQNVVFLGEYAYFNYFQKTRDNTRPPAEFDVLCDHFTLVIKRLEETLSQIDRHKKITRRHGYDKDERFRHVELYVDGYRWVTLWNPDSATSYNEVIFSPQTPGDIIRFIRLGSIETMLLYFYYFFYLDRPYFTMGNKSPVRKKQRLSCIISHLLHSYLQDSNNEGVWKRFSVTCYGKPTKLQEIKLNKSRKYHQLQHNEQSNEYNWLFLKYEPATMRRRKKPKKLINRRTKKIRTK
jgi:hypothetical protein